MKHAHDSARMIAIILSLMLLLGMAPALATEAAPQLTEENLMSEFEAANSPEQLFQRHTSSHYHQEIYAGGELSGTNDVYITAESIYYLCVGDYVCFMTPTSFYDFTPSDAVMANLMTPEENAAMLQSYQKYLTFTEYEELDSFEERDGELLFTTKVTDADAIRYRFELFQAAHGVEIETDCDEGAEIIFQYRADAADLTALEFSDTLRLSDGSEFPLSHVTCVYDEAVPDPAAPDSVLASAFDETAEMHRITVVFASGTPQEQTCQYTVPEDLLASIWYNGEKTSELYEDAEFTQPFEGSNGRTEFTIYVKDTAE